MPTPSTTRALLDRHDGVLLDIYGVILDASGLLTGARELVAELDRRGTPYAFVSNDASRAVATYVAKFRGLGLVVDGSRFVTSGSLLPGYFRDRNLASARTCVLGTRDSEAYVVEGGGMLVPLAPGMEIDALVVADDAGFEFLSGIEWALSAIVRAVEAGRRPALVLPNPDLLYPKSRGELGFTAGAMALLIEAALARRFPREALVFDRLGKPAPDLFLAAAQQLGIAPERLVMIGDQLETDIAGANAAGVPSALLAGSISRWDAVQTTSPATHAATTSPAPHAAATPAAHAQTTSPATHGATTSPTAHAATTPPAAHAQTTSPAAHAATTSPASHAATPTYLLDALWSRAKVGS